MISGASTLGTGVAGGTIGSTGAAGVSVGEGVGVGATTLGSGRGCVNVGCCEVGVELVGYVNETLNISASC